MMKLKLEYWMAPHLFCEDLVYISFAVDAESDAPDELGEDVLAYMCPANGVCAKSRWSIAK